jgi:hypothetical protein
MPHVIRNILTGEYVEATVPSDINTARIFTRVNNATSCGSFNEALHEVVKVDLVEDPKELPRRRGEWLDENEVQRRYGSIGFSVGDDVARPGYGLQPLIVSPPPQDAPNELFCVIKKELHQAVYVQGASGHIKGPVVLKVHPTRELLYRSWYPSVGYLN